MLRTFASLVIDGLAASPLRVAGLALVGFVAQYILFLVFALHPRVLTLRMNESLNASWFLIVLIGCMFTRVLRERALAACFVLAILNIILTALVILERGRAGVNMPMLAIFQLPCFVGVVLSVGGTRTNMRNASIAEWILARVTTPERAASIIGDLAENAESTKAIWFWWSVIRTAFSLLCRRLVANQGRMARYLLLLGPCLPVLAVWAIVHLLGLWLTGRREARRTV